MCAYLRAGAHSPEEGVVSPGAGDVRHPAWVQGTKLRFSARPVLMIGDIIFSRFFTYFLKIRVKMQ